MRDHLALGQHLRLVKTRTAGHSGLRRHTPAGPAYRVGKADRASGTKKAAFRAASRRICARKSEEDGSVTSVKKRSWPSVFSSSRLAMRPSWQLFFFLSEGIQQHTEDDDGWKKRNPDGQRTCQYQTIPQEKKQQSPGAEKIRGYWRSAATIPGGP